LRCFEEIYDLHLLLILLKTDLILFQLLIVVFRDGFEGRRWKVKMKGFEKKNKNIISFSLIKQLMIYLKPMVI